MPVPSPEQQIPFRPHFRVTNTQAARQVYRRLQQSYEHYELDEATTVVVIGGDGKMLQTLGRLVKLRRTRASKQAPEQDTQQAKTLEQLRIYGLNTGHVGFLLNNPDETAHPSLHERVNAAVATELCPLRINMQTSQGKNIVDFAINEVSLLRQKAQSAQITIALNEKTLITLESCDGVLVATPAGSTAYNRAVGGPIIPTSSKLIALTPINLLRPSAWKGALLDHRSKLSLNVHNAQKRPVVFSVDNRSYQDISHATVQADADLRLTLLFDRHHDFEARILQEQFRT